MRIIASLSLLFLAIIANAQSPYSFQATWDFEGDVNTGVIDVATANASNATFAGGVNGIGFVAGNGGGSSYTAQNWPTTTSPAGYLQVCVTTQTGTTFVSGASVSLNFEERRSSTGVRDFEIRASVNGFASFSSLGGPTTPIPDNASWRDQGPYSYTIPAGNPTEVCFRIYGLSAEASAGTWRFDNVELAGTNSLPIELLTFTSRAAENAIALTFSTATETNNDYFSIERSANGFQYTEIGRVNGAGTSYEPQNYSFTDERPLPGKNYYRLRQVDFDGKFSYSPVVTANFGKAQPMTLAPAPATETLRILLEKPIQDDGVWEVFGLDGRLVLSGEMPAENAEYALNINELPNGTYVLRLRVGQVVMNEIFVKE